MKYWTAPLVCALVVGAGAIVQPLARAQETSRLVIVSPRDGAVLPQNRQAAIEARFVPEVNMERTRVRAKIEAARGDQRQVIAEGDIRAFQSPDRLHAIWNVADLTPGNYVITVTAQAGDRTGTASVNVRVHPVPQVAVDVTSVKYRPDGVRVSFSATAHSPADAAIRQFVWTPGDGSPSRSARTGRFSHVFPKAGQTYVVWLEVNDELGGSTLLERDLELPRDPVTIGRGRNHRRSDEIFSPTNDCGCEKMTVLKPTIATPVQSSVYCGDAVPDLPTCVQVPNPAPPHSCPAKQVPYKCQLGQLKPNLPDQPKMGWGFEVVAKLSSNTNNANKCTQGQYSRGTRIVDTDTYDNPDTKDAPPAGDITLPGGANGAGFTFTAVGKPTWYPPFAGPGYGADDYAAPWDFKRHTPQSFRWLDLPQGKVGNNLRAQDDEFITFVQGNLGTCWCRFSIRQKWTDTAGVTGAGLQLIDSHNCGVFNSIQ